MKKTIEIDVDVPEGLDPMLCELLPLLSDKQTHTLQGIVIGLLLSDDTVPRERVYSIARKYQDK